jgi:hypothetical protein
MVSRVPSVRDGQRGTVNISLHVSSTFSLKGLR